MPKEKNPQIKVSREEAHQVAHGIAQNACQLFGQMLLQRMPSNSPVSQFGPTKEDKAAAGDADVRSSMQLSVIGAHAYLAARAELLKDRSERADEIQTKTKAE